MCSDSIPLWWAGLEVKFERAFSGYVSHVIANEHARAYVNTLILPLSAMGHSYTPSRCIVGIIFLSTAVSLPCTSLAKQDSHTESLASFARLYNCMYCRVVGVSRAGGGGVVAPVWPPPLPGARGTLTDLQW